MTNSHRRARDEPARIRDRGSNGAKTTARFRVLDETLETFETWLAERRLERFRARQIRQWMLRDGMLHAARMTNLPQSLRAVLEEESCLRLIECVHVQESADGRTRKDLFRIVRLGNGWRTTGGAHSPLASRTPGQAERLAARDALRTIEAVLMRYDPSSQQRGRRTVCVSTQVGCAVGCPFCATGKLGLAGNLTAGEIVEQVLHFTRCVRDAEGPAARITNVVFMGMGEPFQNYDAVRRAIELLHDRAGPNIGARHMTVSTSGMAPQIRRFAHEPWQVGLAVSLHAADDRKRDLLVPLNRRYPLAELIEAVRYYQSITNRQVTFEWALIEGVNDSPEDARALAALCVGLDVHVNVIPMNPVADAPYQRPPYERTKAFQRLLRDLGLSNTLRVERGVDIAAACGQLRAKQVASTN